MNVYVAQGNSPHDKVSLLLEKILISEFYLSEGGRHSGISYVVQCLCFKLIE